MDAFGVGGGRSINTVDIVERYNRGTRLLHAAVYLAVLAELISGWWFILGSYQPSVIEDLTGIGDQCVHEYVGLLLITVVLIGCGLGWRAVRTFTAESLRFRSSDVRWFRRWPRSVVTGRFEHHDGHFDPGQRLANAAFELHRWSAFLVTPVLLGHIVIASGILPGYRGVWRSMHLGGHLPTDVAKRVWPEWLDRERR